MSSKLLLPSILLLWDSACWAQMENPKPIGTGGPYYPMHMLPESKPVAGTLMSCGSTVTVGSGAQFEVRNTPASCEYRFNVESGVPVTINCSKFRLQCSESNSVGLWIAATGTYKTYCKPDPGAIDVSVPAQSSGHTITFYYDVWGTASRNMICTVTGGSGGSGGGGDGGSGGGGGGTPPTDCGQSTAQPTGRIIEGGLAAAAEYPWQVHITTDSWSCGASIIDNQWLLTAAHCVYEPSTGKQITACVGSNDNRNCKKKIKSTKIIAHSGYTFDNTGNVYPHDIALAKLAEPLVYDDTIRPVCLPASASDKLAIGSDIEIAGWGLVDNSSGSQQLKKAWMKVIDTNRCHNNNAFKLVCMNTDGSSQSPNGRACSGDSGGYGGAKNAQGRTVQYGVASFVAYDNGCLEPNAYTDVAYHVDWIKQQMANN